MLFTTWCNNVCFFLSSPDFEIFTDITKREMTHYTIRPARWRRPLQCWTEFGRRLLRKKSAQPCWTEFGRRLLRKNPRSRTALKGRRERGSNMLVSLCDMCWCRMFKCEGFSDRPWSIGRYRQHASTRDYVWESPARRQAQQKDMVSLAANDAQHKPREM